MSKVAVILAAGRASRFGDLSKDRPKCLFELDPGFTILDLILKHLREMDVQRIVLVTRPEFEEIFMERYPELEVRVNREESSGNLTSMLVGARDLEEEFLLLMSDHIFELEILRRLISRRAERSFVLCLDRNPEWDKLEEGLKIVVRNDVIYEIGKDAPSTCGIDTGLFLCSPKSVRIAEEVIRSKGPGSSIADALSRAIELDEVGYVDVTGLVWADIDTPKDLVRARKVLPKILRRSLTKPEDGPVSRLINRPISTRISVFLYRRGVFISPNLISLISFLLCVGGAYLLSTEPLLSAALIQLGSIVDGIDGEIARLFSRTSKFGALMDTVLDRYADLAVVMAAALTSHMNIMISLLAAANVFTVSYISKIAGTDLRRYSLCTRDVRLLMAAMFVAVELPNMFLLYMASFPTVFAVVSILTTGHEPKEPKKKVRKVKSMKRAPQPEIEETRACGMSEVTLAVVSAFKLAIVILVIRAMSWVIGGYEIMSIGSITMRMADLLWVVQMSAIIYFGYRMLMVMKHFMDTLSSQLVERLGVTETAVSRALLDLTYLTLITVVFLVLPRGLTISRGDIRWVVLVVSSVLLFVMALILYDLMKLLYRSLRGAYERFLETVSEDESGFQGKTRGEKN